MTQDYEAALQYASARLAENLARKDIDEARFRASINWWTAGVVAQNVRPPVVDAGVADELVSRARSGDLEARTILLGVLRYLLIRTADCEERGEGEAPHIPPILLRYAADVLWEFLPVSHKQRRSTKNFRRDHFIADAIDEVRSRFGLAPTRNYAARDVEGAAESSCSVVAKALARNGIHLSEDAVEKIWQRWASSRGA